MFYKWFFSNNTASIIKNSIAKSNNVNKLTSQVEELGYKGGEKIKVFVIFNVNTQGKVEIINVRAPHKIFENEARKLVNSLPQFTPRVINGKAINQKYTLPIVFKIETKREKRRRLKKEKRKN